MLNFNSFSSFSPLMLRLYQDFLSLDKETQLLFLKKIKEKRDMIVDVNFKKQSKKRKPKEIKEKKEKKIKEKEIKEKKEKKPRKPKIKAPSLEILNQLKTEADEINNIQNPEKKKEMMLKLTEKYKEYFWKGGNGGK